MSRPCPGWDGNSCRDKAELEEIEGGGRPKKRCEKCAAQAKALQTFRSDQIRKVVRDTVPRARAVKAKPSLLTHLKDINKAINNC
jgi:hypothetical protein